MPSSLNISSLEASERRENNKEETSPNNSEAKLASISLPLAVELTKRIAFYEGLGDLGGASSLYGFDPAKLVARDVAGRHITPEVPFLDVSVISAADRSALAPIGKGFERLLEEMTVRSRSTDIADTWYNYQLASAWPYTS